MATDGLRFQRYLALIAREFGSQSHQRASVFVFGRPECPRYVLKLTRDDPACREPLHSAQTEMLASVRRARSRNKLVADWMYVKAATRLEDELGYSVDFPREMRPPTAQGFVAHDLFVGEEEKG